MADRIRVLIVDDSRLFRAALEDALAGQPDIDVIGSVFNGAKALEFIRATPPDVITLDVEMPRMGGIEFLERIMRLRPMPVIMVSTLTQAGAATTLEALELGAFDCVGKPDFDGLVDKVKAAAHSRVRGRDDRPAPPPRPAAFEPADRVLAIGSSTGGVEALISILQCFPENCPPTVITQHMPATFTKSFAARLDRMCAAQVEEAEEGAPVKAGRIYLAPGAAHLEVAGAKDPVCRLRQSEPVSGHRPSVDVLFDSVARGFGPKAVGVILTGMGKDGARGLLAMRQAGARTLGQDEASCVVYGMPKVAFEMGAVETQLPLGRIAAAALELCSISTARGVR
jgi:two-component system chemotaxis response regulator CheB